MIHFDELSTLYRGPDMDQVWDVLWERLDHLAWTEMALQEIESRTPVNGQQWLLDQARVPHLRRMIDEDTEAVTNTLLRIEVIDGTFPDGIPSLLRRQAE